MVRYFLGAALAVASLVSAGAVSAQPRSTPRPDVMVVRLSDLDMSHSAGAQTALRRIRSAASQFCGDDGSHELYRVFEQQKCVTRMTDKAVDALNVTQVTALWTGQGSHGSESAITLASRDRR